MQNFYNQKLKKLINNKIPNPELDLRLIIKRSQKINKDYMENKNEIENLNIKKFNNFFKRRINGEPISKIFKNREFWSLDFFINNNVLDPRPETEFILEGIIKHLPNQNKKYTICDLGTGSACIIISFLKEYKNSIGIGVDISKSAIKVANKNSLKHNTQKRLELKTTNWKNMNQYFDIIVSNPPYIKNTEYKKLQKEVKNYDPKISLLGGETGLKKISELTDIAYRCMKKNSIFLMEIGHKQKCQVEKMFLKNNLYLIDTLKDLQGIDRVLIFKKN